MKWRSRFAVARLEGLSDEARAGVPRKVTDAHVETVIAGTFEEKPPNGDTHWSSRSMARTSGLSQSTASRMWRAFGLKPHLVDTWKQSTDPLFVDKVRDVVGVYLGPPEKAIVLCRRSVVAAVRHDQRDDSTHECPHNGSCGEHGPPAAVKAADRRANCLGSCPSSNGRCEPQHQWRASPSSPLAEARKIRADLPSSCPERTLKRVR